MSNLTSRMKKLISEPKVTLQKVKYKLKNNPKEAWDIIKYEVKNDTVQLKQAIRKRLPIKYNGKNHFTIVSACYNVEKYLDEYFESIVTQSLDFKKHIQIICVDDGSQDDTAKIIKRWQKKYPENIHYFYKENGGQASARNLGIQYVETEWVTFIDPDDFVSDGYFLKVDSYITNKSDLALVSCPFIFYIEDEKSFKDTHPLKFRFSNRDLIYRICDLKDKFQLSVNSAFFRTDFIIANEILFDNIRPNFEDAKFVGEYLSQVDQNEKVAFISGCQYFYRKRSDGTSTLDGAWKNPNLFSQVLSDGCLDLLENSYQRLGYVPEYSQRAVLYHLAWYFKYIVNNKSALDILDSKQKDDFLDLLHKIFQYIDEKLIMNFNLVGTWWLQRVAWLGYFKKKDPSSQIVYIDLIDKEKKQILLYYFTSKEDNFESISINGNDCLPIYSKVKYYDFVDTPYVYEKRLWVSYDEDISLIRVNINGVPTNISLFGKVFKNGCKINEIISKFSTTKYKSDGSWVLMDRNTQADDNAEHLYRYISRNYPEQKIYFGLDRHSHDWDRLAEEGFNLLPFGSGKFEKVLRNASRLISSHVDEYIYNYFGDHFNFSKKFVFLQHGVTHNDLSDWLNSKRYLSCLISATNDEYHEFADQRTKYKFTEKETALTGFARHDALLKDNKYDSKVILIMPTWRQSIVGGALIGNERTLNSEFMETAYAKHWFSFIHSSELKSLSEKYGYRVIFAPHANIEPYLKLFNVPQYIETWSAKASDKSIQSLFQIAKFMITDYSSVAFEMAVLNKQVLYYQFDKDSFFNGGHAFKAGYFGYETHGFGPVVYDEETLLSTLRDILNNDGNPVEPYKTRIDKTFPFRDGKNCERIYQAIKALDEPETKLIDLDVLRNYVGAAYQHKAWDLLLSRCELLEQYGNENDQDRAKRLKLEALLGVRQFTELDLALAEYQDKQHICSLMARKAFFQQQWKNSSELFESMEQLSDDDYMMLAQCYAELHQTDKLNSLLAKADFDESRNVIALCYLAISEDRWNDVVELLEQHLSNCEIDLLKRDKPQLLLARAYRMLNDFTSAHKQLVAYEKHTVNDDDCCVEVAHLAFAQSNYEKVINQLNKIKLDIVDFPESSLIEYVTSSKNLNKFNALEEKAGLLVEKYSHIQPIMNYLVNMYIKQENWAQAEVLSKKCYSDGILDMIHPLVLSSVRQGKLDEAYKIHIKPDSESSYGYLELIYELAIMFEDIELAKYCLKQMIAKYPNVNKDSNLNKLLSLSK